MRSPSCYEWVSPILPSNRGVEILQVKRTDDFKWPLALIMASPVRMAPLVKVGYLLHYPGSGGKVPPPTSHDNVVFMFMRVARQCR